MTTAAGTDDVAGGRDGLAGGTGRATGVAGGPGGSRTQRVAAVLLVVTAVIAVPPVVAWGMLRSGSEWLAMWATTTRTPLTLVVGVLLLSAPAATLALIAAAVGAWRGLRWAAAVGWCALLAVAVVLVGPLSNVSLVSWLPGGRVVGLALALGAAILLLPLSRHGQPGQAGLLGWFGTGFLGCVGILAALGVVAGGLPGQPWPGLSSQLRLGSGTPAPFDAPMEAQNPDMAQFPYSAIHNDASQTDLYPSPLNVSPATAEVRSFAAGGGCASLAWDSAGNLAAVCVSDSVTAYVLDPESLTVLARYRISDRPFTADFFTDFGGGGYMYLNAADEIVTPTLRRTVLVLEQVRSDDGLALRPRVEYDLSSALLTQEQPTSALPDSSGRIWFVGQLGTVGYIEPETGAVVSRQWPGEDIENSFATGDDNDVYVVSSAALRRLSAGPEGVQVQWEAQYDSGVRRKPGQTSRASGTTPTLHGDGWVSIADNGEPMHIDVFRQADGTRLCHLPVFGAESGATENSLVALGDDLLVENNYGYRLFGVIGGHSTEPGLARVNVDAQVGCSIAWTNPALRIPSVVSKASAASGVALTYTKDRDVWGVDRWWITAVGLGDGEIVWQRLAGVGPARNNHYAAIYISPEGEVFVGTVMGILSLKNPTSAVGG